MRTFVDVVAKITKNHHIGSGWC